MLGDSCPHERLLTLFSWSSAQISTLPYSLPYPNQEHMIQVMGSNLVLGGEGGGPLTRDNYSVQLPPHS